MNNPDALRKVCIVGGGTAGWIAAAVMAHHMKGRLFEIELVESDDIGTIGVGESTIPPFLELIAKLDINEQDFIRQVQASFKLGIEFKDWHKKGENYFHPFGDIGQRIELSEFYQAWRKATLSGHDYPLQDFAPATVMAREGRFMLPFKAQKTPIAGASYALHVDAKRVAQFLRTHAEARGVKRTEGMVTDVALDERGFVSALTLKDGRTVEADFFIDCSGFRALLIGKTLGTEYTDWSNYLFCDRAIAAQTENVGPPSPYTLAEAQDAGWRWRIPLQHRTGNGHVYASEFMSDEEATRILLDKVEGEVVAGPMVVPFKTGVRQQIWHKNVLSLGLASGFIEPLESTAIWLIQSGLSRFLTMFPDRDFNQADIDRYNRIMQTDYEEIRDFLVLHYHATERTDSPFWNYCRTMEIPERLAEKMRVFRTHGRAFRENEELFNDTSWFAVMLGQLLEPASHDPVADVMPLDETRSRLAHIREAIANSADYMPRHRDFIRDNCAA
jgi:tryptophan halogenase